MAALDKANASQDPKKKEKYEKNVQKQSTANTNYAKACNDLENYLRQVESRVEVAME
jgi:hypothetical protein